MSYFSLMPRQNGPFHEKCNGNNLYFSLPSVQNLNVATCEYSICYKIIIYPPTFYKVQIQNVSTVHNMRKLRLKFAALPIALARHGTILPIICGK